MVHYQKQNVVRIHVAQHEVKRDGERRRAVKRLKCEPDGAKDAQKEEHEAPAIRRRGGFGATAGRGHMSHAKVVMVLMLVSSQLGVLCFLLVRWCWRAGAGTTTKTQRLQGGNVREDDDLH